MRELFPELKEADKLYPPPPREIVFIHAEEVRWTSANRTALAGPDASAAQPPHLHVL